MNDLALLSKSFYLVTILLMARLLYLSIRYRRRNKFIRTMSYVYAVLTPLYTVFAIMYVVDVLYHAAIGYIGWTAINILFISTDSMLLEYIIHHVPEEDAREG